MKHQHLTAGMTLSGFTVECVIPVTELRSTALQLRHDRTGARLLHLYNDDPDNLFCVAFRTPVFDNTGVAHILEHSVLGGSRKFPLRDPFQVLLKGSLQTFLNAMTYPDRTVYPVSSQIEADYFNLVNVYCDAVFHPLLTPQTLYQEGWHFDLDTPDAPVTIKGIVYNEMKGVFADFSSHVARKTLGALFPDTTYFYESGGEPEHIPELTWERFTEFHRRYYHPSNAWIVLYGNIPTEKQLAFLDNEYLRHFGTLSIDSAIAPQPLWDAPRTVTFEAPAPKEDDGTASVIVSWLAGTSTSPDDQLIGSVLSRYLLAAQGSPLRRALIDSGLGEDLDDMSGFDQDLCQGVFAVGLRKTRPEHAPAIRDLVFSTLQAEVERGLDVELLEGALRRTEFKLREIGDGGGRYPYHLRLVDRCLRSWIYDGDPLAHLAFEAPLARITEAVGRDPHWFGAQLERLLLTNPHHLVSVVCASSNLAGRLEEQSCEQAGALSASFTKRDREQHCAITRELRERQQAVPTPPELACIPLLAKSDLPPRNQTTPCENTPLPGESALFQHPLFTAGIVYVDVGFDCSGLPARLVPFLPLYCEMATRCGAGGRDYEQMSRHLSLVCGGMSASIMADEGDAPASQRQFRYFLHGKCLTQRVDEMLGAMEDLLTTPRLDNKKLLRDVLLEMRNDMRSSIIGSGHTFAASRAAGFLSPLRRLAEELDGIDQLRFLDSLARSREYAATTGALQELHERIVCDQRLVVSLTADEPQRWLQGIAALTDRLPQAPEHLPGELPHQHTPVRAGIEINASVNFVARAWQLPPQDPRGLGLCALLGQNLSRGHLWDTVRVEGGAYGAFASLGATFPVFACASYRDPNCEVTLRRFEEGLALLAATIDRASVDQSIIGTIGQFDKPRSPHSRGFGETCARLLGKSEASRQRTRDAVLEATPEELAAKAREILDSPCTAVAILANRRTLRAAQESGALDSIEPLLTRGT